MTFYRVTDRGMEEDAQNLVMILKYIPSCMRADDIEQLLQDIPVQPPVVVPVRTVQVAVAAGTYDNIVYFIFMIS